MPSWCTVARGRFCGEQIDHRHGRVQPRNRSAPFHQVTGDGLPRPGTQIKNSPPFAVPRRVVQHPVQPAFFK